MSASRIVTLLFLLSGASGLLFETLWTYQATLALGSSAWAVTAVLSAFMAGLALGNLLALRRSVWTLSTYAALEGTILVSGLAALFLLPALGRILAPLFGSAAAHPALLHLLRFAIAFAVLVVPSTAMGMTLPALAQALGTGFIGDGDYIRSLCASAEPTADAYPKRIIAAGSGENRMYESWYDLAACEDRFRRSASLAEIWPPELKEKTLAYFRWEGTLTTLGTFPRKSRFPDFAEIHRLCSTTTLKTPLVWLLGSDRDSLRAARQAEPEVQRRPPAQFHLGAGALADRDYARAAGHFLKTVESPGMRRIDLAVCLYALCMAGRTAEAKRTLAAVWDEGKMNAIPPEYWTWMKATFNLKTPPGKGG
ncbi:MAG: hypothetical protein HY293_21080 [Planctomycetes bacterium]|nr:hypothetical protein [Planctomycetota bacterium]